MLSEPFNRSLFGLTLFLVALISTCGASNAYNPSDPASADSFVREIVQCVVQNCTGGASSGAGNALQCPAGFLRVPADTSAGTTTDFCIAKYEMKDDGSGNAVSQANAVPWGSVDQNTARTQCSALGTGFHLVTNAEWMTTARNIESVAGNWSSGTVGTGSLNGGHNDNAPANTLAAGTDAENCFGTGQGTAEVCAAWNSQIRTHRLSTGEAVWDLGGNLWEWVDSTIDNTDKACPSAAPQELTACVTFTASMPQAYFKGILNLDSTNGVGRYIAGNSGVGGAATRGGRFSDTGVAGLYALNMNFDATAADPGKGFRCAYAP